MDGWGLGDDIPYNAVSRAETPNFDFIVDNFPTSKLRTDGPYVGLLPGQMGNSEVGHVTIGAGRAIQMSLPKIDNGIKNGSLKKNVVVKQFVEALKKSGGVAHLAGLFSSGGVHAHQDHMIYFANVLAAEEIKVKLHLFLDGRDVPPKTALDDIKQLKFILPENVDVATLIGRFYAMDRDNRWDRVEKAFDLLSAGIGQNYDDPEEAILSQYGLGKTDEFIKPCVIQDYKGFSQNSDSLFFMNYRSDRARELLLALCDPKFDRFQRRKSFSLVSQIGLVEYSKEHSRFMQNILVPEFVKNTLGEYLSKNNKTQYRIAETEKYPHVTFFFNSGVEVSAAGESRSMVPSPKVSTYDLLPEMSAKSVTKKVVGLIRENAYDFILVNYANPDMVGHTGNLNATITACEAVDSCLGDIFRAINEVGAVLILTADHGNCELMYDLDHHSPHTSHTLNPVPISVVGVDGLSELRNGSLSDIAPTILNILNMDVPNEMTGNSLLKF